MTDSEPGTRDWVEHLVETNRERLEDAAALDVQDAPPVVSLDQALGAEQA